MESVVSDAVAAALVTCWASFDDAAGAKATTLREEAATTANNAATAAAVLLAGLIYLVDTSLLALIADQRYLWDTVSFVASYCRECERDIAVYSATEFIRPLTCWTGPNPAFLYRAGPTDVASRAMARSSALQQRSSLCLLRSHSLFICC